LFVVMNKIQQKYIQRATKIQIGKNKNGPAPCHKAKILILESLNPHARVLPVHCRHATEVG